MQFGAPELLKLLWIVPPLAFALLWRAQQRRLAWAVAGFVLLPLLMIPFALDTTRTIGFGFLGLLIGLAALQTHLDKPLHKKLTLALLAANLLIPSASYGQDFVVMESGLYEVIWSLFGGPV